MKQRATRSGNRLAAGSAVASLLRLASLDLNDAKLLSAGRNPGNALLLAGQAFGRLLLAVAATERGWPLPPFDGAPSLIPDANPLKTRLGEIGNTLPSPPGVSPDGSPPPAADREVIRAGLSAVSDVLRELARRFDVELTGDGPAGRAGPIRPEPVPPVQAKATVVTARRAEPKPPPPPDPHDVEGRSPIGLKAAAGNTASTAFWALMDQWGVGDLAALDLIGQPGGLTKKGTRPRFKLTGEQGALLQGLQEIDSALALLRLDAEAWLAQPIKGAPFDGATPLDYLIQARMTGVRDTIKFILQHGLKLSMSTGRTAAGVNPAAA